MPHTLFYVAGSAEKLALHCLARMRRLRDEGFAVHVATPYTAGLDELASEGFSTRPLPGVKPWNIAGRAAAYPILQGDFLTSPPALVHGFGAPWAWIAAYAATRAQVPAIFATIERQPLGHPLQVRAHRKLASWVDRYMVHHEEDLEAALARNIAPRRRLELLLGGYGVTLERFDPDDDLDAVPRPAGARTVVATSGGRSSSAVRKVIERRSPGVGWLEYDGLVSPQLLLSADILLSLDSDDAIGHDLMAAAAMRVPTVAVDSPAARTVIVDHETGRIAGRDDDLTAVLAELIDNPKRAADMGLRARARAELRFDRRQIDEQLLSVYDRVLSERLR